MKDLGKFKGLNSKSSSYKLSISLSPVLKDYWDSAGSATGHYFWQDLICARWIFDGRPSSHFDVASRVDGFIAHLLSFREVTILDIRPLDVIIPNLTVTLGDAQNDLSHLKGKYSSVSSLHSIEHFGLGRYGDNLDSEGHEKGLKNIAGCVSEKGALYVSFPIGKAAVEFNAQRIIDPLWAVRVLTDFTLEEFVLIPWKDQPVYGLSPEDVDTSVWGQAGVYRFKRNH
jgi:hypothetical protein